MVIQMKNNFVDLFAGCGGLSLGMEQAGFQVAFASDIDPICSQTYLANRALGADKMFVGDIAELNRRYSEFAKQFANVALVCGGPPCQGFSTANRQRLINDPRNVLYKEYLVFLKNSRPKFFVMENVKGMLNKTDEILADIKEYLGQEYDVFFDVFNAKNFGVPQNRERLFLIGNRIGVSSKQIIEEIHNRETTTPRFTLYDAIADLPQLEPNRIKNNNKSECAGTGYTRIEYSYAATPFYSFINGERKIDYLYNHKNRYNNDRDIEIFTRLPQGANSLHECIADIMPYKSRNGIFKDKYFKLRFNDVCKTITSHMRFDCNMYIHPTQARGLSPREAARIQTFPDDFVFFGPQNSWYKQIGNAVPVKLAQVIGEEIIKYL